MPLDNSDKTSKNNAAKTAAIILAAGQSKRLGVPKQTVLFEGVTLLQRTVTTVLNSPIDLVIVVLGSLASESLQNSLPKSVRVVVNQRSADGISSSIRAGLGAIDNDATSTGTDRFDSALFLTCDQPFLTTQLIAELLRQHRNSESLITASSYSNCLGVPVIFSRELFAELKDLRGDSGARSIIRKYQQTQTESRETNPRELVTAIEFPKGEIDIDTAADLSHLLNMSQDCAAQVDT